MLNHDPNLNQGVTRPCKESSFKICRLGCPDVRFCDLHSSSCNQVRAHVPLYSLLHSSFCLEKIFSILRHPKEAHPYSSWEAKSFVVIASEVDCEEVGYSA